MCATATAPAPTTAVTYRCKKCQKSGRKVVRQVLYGRRAERYGRQGTVQWFNAEGAKVLSHDIRSPWTPSLACPECGEWMEGRTVVGRYSEHVACDARCTTATGHQCECSCGGKNHGADHR